MLKKTQLYDPSLLLNRMIAQREGKSRVKGLQFTLDHKNLRASVMLSHFKCPGLRGGGV